MKLKIEYVSKEELKPYANNAKIHTEEQIEQIKKSIKEFGFNDPIAIWKNNEVIEGHGRLLAIMEMDNIQQVPIIRLDTLSDEQRKAYMLVHNQLTMNTDFDDEILNVEIDDIVNIDMKQFGFDEYEFELIDENNLDDDTEKTNVNVTIVFPNHREYTSAKEMLVNISEQFDCNISVKMI